MKETKYTYAVAYLKTLENKMLSQNDIENLINSDGISECIKLLRDRGYGKDATDQESIDKILSSELAKVWTEAKNVAPVDAPLDVLLYQNDFHNLKTILKATIMGTAWENLVLKPCIENVDLIAEAVKNNDFSELSDFIKEPAQKGYEIVTKTNDGQLLEVYLDRALLQEMKKRCDSEKNDFLSGWVELNILLADFKIAIRAVGRGKEFLNEAMIPSTGFDYKRLMEASSENIEAVKDEIISLGYPDAIEKLNLSFSEFEKWCDNKKMQYIKDAKLKFFGFEPILGFLIGKEFEVQALRIILAGKENNIDVDIIRERLRDLYV